MATLPKITVIVMALKEKDRRALSECVQSISDQSYPETETVVVFESAAAAVQAAPKGCLACCPQEGKGFISSVKAALSKASGEYYYITEGENLLTRDLLRKMLRRAQEKRADLCIADTLWRTSGRERKYIPYEEIRNRDLCFEGKGAFGRFVEQRGYDPLWESYDNKLIRREALEGALETAESFANRGHEGAERLALMFALFACANGTVNCHNVYSCRRGKPMQRVGMEGDSAAALKAMRECFDFAAGICAGIGENHDEALKEWQNVYRTELCGAPGNAGMHAEAEKKGLPDQPQWYPAELGEEYDAYEKIIEEICSEQTEVVSFDIFDTLLLRTVLYPSDVFVLLSADRANRLCEAPLLKFAEIRMAAEEGARRGVKSGEIGLSDIYAYMVQNYGVDEKLAERLLSEEIELEKKLSVVRKTGHDLYDIACLRGKKIVYTSDMYLPEEAVFSLLENAGYSRSNKLYLSQSHKRSKFRGDLFQLLAQECPSGNRSVVHIGDNYVSDVRSARKSGIRAYHLPNVRELFLRNIWEDILKENRTYIDLENTSLLGVRAMFAIVANKLFDFPFVHKFTTFQCSTEYVGYFAVGMHLFAYVDWILKNSEGYRKLHFAARDSYLPMLAYEYFRGLSEKPYPEADYFYLSRRFLYALAVIQPEDLFASVNLINIYSHSIEKMLRYFPAECLIREEIAKIPERARCKKFKDMDEFCKWVPVLCRCIDFDALHKYQERVKAYLGTIYDRNDLLVDIGYSGRGEAVLTRLLGFRVNSVYLHPYKDDLGFNVNAYGFRNKCFYEYKPRVTGEPREFVFMKNACSFLKYDFSEEKVAVVFDEENRNSEIIAALVGTLQENALSFVKDFCGAHRERMEALIYVKEVASIPWEHYLHRSDDLDKIFFKSILFENDIDSGFTNMFDIWCAQAAAFKNPPVCERRGFLYRMADRLLPKGTRRREFVKGIAKKVLRR